MVRLTATCAEQQGQIAKLQLDSESSQKLRCHIHHPQRTHPTPDVNGLHLFCPRLL